MGKTDDRIDYLEEERKKIWSELVRLQKEINIKPSDYENEAKQASRKASEFRNKCEDAKNQASQHLEDLAAKVNSVNLKYTLYDDLYNQLVEKHNHSVEISEQVNNLSADVENKTETIQTHISELEELYENLTVYNGYIEQLETLVENTAEYTTKTDTLYKSLLTKRKDIDQLYSDIIGFSEEDVDGKKTFIPGLKKQLEDAFENASNDLELIENAMIKVRDDYNSQYEIYVTNKKSEFNTTLEGWKSNYASVYTRIEDLLPNALTAGLSHAYAEKKSAELDESSGLTKTFNNAIMSMVAVSLIPFAFSIWSLINKVDLKGVINDMPRLVLAILPLYIPILWVAYSSNKRINLSKRLIEEYTHKEVLSKTYEGLSTQINNISNNEISSDLRTRLLYNILEVNSENPGKLITDYNKADHPLMDALDKSVKLGDAVDKLTKIPGFKKLSKSLDKKSKNILKDKTKKANAGLRSLSNEENISIDTESLPVTKAIVSPQNSVKVDTTVNA